MMIAVSDVLKELLNRQGIDAGNRAGTRKLARKIARTAGTGAASVKGPDPKARPVYREVMRQTAGEKPLNDVREPSPARGRPVLQLLQGGSSKPSRAGKAQLRLVLT